MCQILLVPGESQDWSSLLIAGSLSDALEGLLRVSIPFTPST